MRKGYRITFKSFDLDNPSGIPNKSILMEGKITKPKNYLDFSLAHEQQTGLFQKTLDKIINEKASFING